MSVELGFYVWGMQLCREVTSASLYNVRRSLAINHGCPNARWKFFLIHHLKNGGLPYSCALSYWQKPSSDSDIQNLNTETYAKITTLNTTAFCEVVTYFNVFPNTLLFCRVSIPSWCGRQTWRSNSSEMHSKWRERRVFMDTFFQNNVC